MNAAPPKEGTAQSRNLHLAPASDMSYLDTGNGLAPAARPTRNPPQP
jgi:hypothetical protein